MISIHLSKGIFLYSIVLAVIVGASFGSFLNCAAWRCAHGEPWWKGRSRCPDCGHPLAAPDLVPVLSWLFLRGRCRYCGKAVPVRYLLTELFFALVTVACLLRFDLTPLGLRNWGFLCCLFCLALTDLENCVIPDGCLVTACALWLAALPFWKPTGREVLSSLGAGVLYSGALLGFSLLMDRLLGRESLGGGDIKLFAVVGLYLGLWGTLFTMILACVLGLLLGLVRREREGQIPFGPAIGAAAALMLLYGDGFLQWYMSLLR